MENGVNVLVIQGGVVRVPELRYSGDGLAYTGFPIANTNIVYKNGEKTEEVSFFDVTVFGRLAEICATYLKKGTRVIISGKIRQSRWVGKEGNKRSKVQIIAQDVKFLPSSHKKGSYSRNNEEVHSNRG